MSNPPLAALVAIAAIAVGLAVFGLGALAELVRGPPPPFAQTQVAPTRSAAPQRDPDVLQLAGSGSNLPVTRALTDGFRRVHPEARILVHSSIGSTGGVRAAHDGAVDVGLVSRPLDPAEQALGLRVIPYARVAAVFGANVSVPVHSVDRTDVLDLYGGRRPTWPDGTPVVVLQRERGDSGHRVLADRIDGFGEVDREALDARRWRVLYRESSMHEALVATRGAIGLVDLGSIVAERLAVRVLAFEGVEPTEANVRDGSYPLAKELAFVLTDAGAERAAEFVRFSHSPEGEEIVRSHGYVPIREAGLDDELR
jgi:phosphate transport system substrate-binding protein